MATFTKLDGFVEHLAEGAHNLGSNQLVVALSNTAPGSESSPPTASTANCILANVTQISYTDLSSRNVTTLSSAQTSGTYKLDLQDLVLTATGGNVGPFQYVYLYNDTATSPVDALIGYWNLGAAQTILDGSSYTLNLDNTSGTVSLA